MSAQIQDKKLTLPTYVLPMTHDTALRSFHAVMDGLIRGAQPSNKGIIEKFNDWFDKNLFEENGRFRDQIIIKLASRDSDEKKEIVVRKGKNLIFFKDGSSSISSGHYAPSYPEIADRLTQFAAIQPTNYHLGLGNPPYDHLIAQDILAVMQGKMPTYYTSDQHIQYFAEFATLLAFESSPQRDPSFKQFGTNLLLLDMIAKQQTYGQQGTKRYLFNNAFDSAVRSVEGLKFKRTDDAEKSVRMSSKEPDHAPVQKYKKIDPRQRYREGSGKIEGDIIGGKSPVSTKSPNQNTEGIFAFNRKLRGSEFILDSEIVNNRVLVKQAKLIFYWLKNNGFSHKLRISEKAELAKIIEKIQIKEAEMLSFGLKDNKNVIKNLQSDMDQIQVDISKLKEKLPAMDATYKERFESRKRMAEAVAESNRNPPSTITEINLYNARQKRIISLSRELEPYDQFLGQLAAMQQRLDSLQANLDGIIKDQLKYDQYMREIQKIALDYIKIFNKNDDLSKQYKSFFGKLADSNLSYSVDYQEKKEFEDIEKSDAMQVDVPVTELKEPEERKEARSEEPEEKDEEMKSEGEEQMTRPIKMRRLSEEKEKKFSEDEEKESQAKSGQKRKKLIDDHEEFKQPEPHQSSPYIPPPTQSQQHSGSQYRQTDYSSQHSSASSKWQLKQFSGITQTPHKPPDTYLPTPRVSSAPQPSKPTSSQTSFQQSSAPYIEFRK